MVNVWRFMNIVFLIALWIYQDPPLVSFLFVISLAIIVCLRWRFRLPSWTIIIDLILCFLFIPLWGSSAYGLALPVYEMMSRQKYRFLIVVILLIALFELYSIVLLWLLFQAGTFGVWDASSKKQRERYITEADRERHARQALENVKEELLKSNRKTAQLAEVSERNRIARDLHDHVGHDLTGANLALEAYEQLEGREAEAMLNEVKLRVARSTAMLRDTVHDMTPVTRIGVDVLEHIAKEFIHTSVSFQRSGDMKLVPAHYWGLLEPCLKEALTNVARHSDATEVNVNLDVTTYLVRLSIQDNGTESKHLGEGSGIRNLKVRARANGGSVTVNTVNGYQVVCVLPLEEDKR
ncbi:hypothetical protein DH09_01490 [Bacillaceae bacterium JMAK1]|nr:hypothetical protein DH09_01490 [Bacillaceae bacterium JMAK1]